MPAPTARPADGPGLNRDELLALRRPRHDTDLITGRIRDHLESHDGYLAFSGGKDSTVALHLALQAEPDLPVAFFDSGLEFPETYRYIEQLQHDWDIDLHWYTAQTATLEALTASGAWDHHAAPAQHPVDLHDTLITEPAARAHTDHGPGEIWGVRASESRGRAALYARALNAETTRTCRGCCAPPAVEPTQEQIQHHTGPQLRRQRHGGLVRRQDGTVAYGPVWDWKDVDIWAYLARHQLPINSVYDKLRRLGAPEHFLRVSHMLDGSRLEEGRASWLRRGWPGLFDELAQVLPRLREFI